MKSAKLAPLGLTYL